MIVKNLRRLKLRKPWILMDFFWLCVNVQSFLGQLFVKTFLNYHAGTLFVDSPEIKPLFL